MKEYRRKTVGAVLAAVLLAAGATACDDGEKADTGAVRPSRAAGRAGAGGAGDMAPVAYLERVQKKSEGITSLRYTMSGTAAGQTISGEVAMRLKPQVAMSMVMADPRKAGEKIDIRLLDGAMYMGAQGKWLKFDLKAANPQAAGQLEALSNAGQGAENPGDRAGALRASKDLKKVGEETVDGQRTTHLAGTVTLDQMRAAAAAAATPEAKERQEAQVKQLEKQGVTSLQMDMWIDGSDHTKQVRVQGRTQQGPMDLTMKFTGLNEPVRISAPPADQVVDLSEAMKKRGATAGATAGAASAGAAG
ncbi:LppX_LprAFG lipoprotein [Streptomyces sp. NRRL S-87]|uniref:LppX_LprAFG lipoprotein n=1 Tax=Streptomyces sp. NRRL S-87 TaxID=1463920 RepID=UPI0007C4F44B|nr:LppX_LprAFG lipoprotein [Streptomyces sp. NRRL S-87]